MIPGSPSPFFIGADVPAVLTYTAAVGDQGGGSPWSFASVAIGTAASDRYVIVGVFAPSTATASADAITGVTCGGVAMTRLAAVNTASTNHQLAFYGLLVTSGTTANIVVSTAVGRASMSIAVWNVTGLLSTTPVATASDVTVSANALSASITPTVGGILLGIAMVQSAPQTCTWTNNTESVDSPFPVDPASSASMSGSGKVVTAAGAVTVTATFTGSDAGGDNSLLLLAMR